MFKRYSIIFIGLLTSIVGFHIGSAQAQVAQDAYAIFKRSCLGCHGAGGPAAPFLLIEDHSALVAEGGAVVPGDPDASRLYKRLLGEGGALMPAGGPPLPDAEIETVKSWISAGAADWATSPPSIDHTVSKPPIHVDDGFTVNINAETAFDVAKWQLDIAYDPAALRLVGTSEGDLLTMGGGTTDFHDGSLDSAAGTLTGLSAERQGDGGVTGAGALLHVQFRALSSGETKVTLQNLQFNASAGWYVSVDPYEITLTVEEQAVAGDVNGDGQVNILDLVAVAQQLGKSVPADSPADVNGDGVVNILDLVQVAQHFAAAAPAAVGVGTGDVDPATVESWIAQARLRDDGSLAFKQGVENLKNLLAGLIPNETVLLRNYPNPFNPETWIPYQLAEPAEVALTIYDMNGELVRHLAVGHQAPGVYRSRSRAVYWDGRNQFGEFVVSGLYFYTLRARSEIRADGFTATRKMLILK